MSSICVITDSHSGITQSKAKELGVSVLPMPFTINETCYYEDITLSREEFFQKLASGAEVSTSQAVPSDVMDLWDEALKTYDEVLYIPISSGLSGSCATAMALAQDEPYEGRVFVVDNGRVSALQYRSVLDALEMIQEGYHAAQIKQMLEEAKADETIYVAVNTLEHLKRGGRISTTTAVLGSILNIKPVLQFDVGMLHSYKNCRGFHSAKKAMIEAMRHDLENKFKEWYDRGEVYLLAAGSTDEAAAKEWVKEIEEAFPGMPVLYADLSLGLCCHIGEGGLGIGCSCKPRRLPL